MERDRHEEIVRLPAVSQLGQQLADAGERHRRRRTRRRRAGFFVSLATVCLAALIAAASLTPPGAAVGDFLGIGDVGDDPTVEQHAANERGSVVIGGGETPDGERFEVVASRLGRSEERPDDICLLLDLLSTGAPAIGACVTEYNRSRLERGDEVTGHVNVAPRELGPDTALVVMGLTTSDAGSVTVTYPDADGNATNAPVTFAKLTPELADRIGSEDLAAIYIGFIPDRAFPDLPLGPNEVDPALDTLAEIEAVLYDAEGDEISRVPFDPERDLMTIRETPAQ